MTDRIDDQAFHLWRPILHLVRQVHDGRIKGIKDDRVLTCEMIPADHLSQILIGTASQLLLQTGSAQFDSLLESRRDMLAVRRPKIRITMMAIISMEPRARPRAVEKPQLGHIIHLQASIKN